MKVPRDIDRKPESRRRFLREARAAARFEHPNFCPIYQIDEHNGVPYLVMAYIEGKPLSDLIFRGQPWDLYRATRMVHELAVALGEAHRKGVVHRDLKPSNVMINTDGRLILMDFGLVRRLDASETSFTADGTILGTPAYMPPEQAEGRIKEVGVQSDVYSLGVILYELLSGSRPFLGMGFSLLSLVVKNQPPAPSVHNPKIEPALEAVVLKAMAKRPEDRFGSMTEFAHALNLWLESQGSPEVGSRSGSLSTRTSIINSVGMKLVTIPAGEFLMGSDDSDSKAYAHEKPRHRVRITRAFDLGVHPVTQGQYRAITGRNPSEFRESDDHPVEQVSWFDAVEFCIELSRREGLRPCYGPGGVTMSGGDGYRLPTEAEWEYACRAEGSTRYLFGDDPSSLGDHAWFVGNADSKTQPVGRKRANAFGLHDMIGNVWEWTGDGYDEFYYQHSPTDDPTGPARAARRVFRGGAWNGGSQTGRSAYRGRAEPDDRDKNLGFRVVRIRPA